MQIKLFISLLFFSVFLQGCEKKSLIVVKKEVEVYKNIPDSISNKNVEVLGILQPGEEWDIRSVHYDKEFAVYEIYLPESRFGVKSGYLYLDSRYFYVKDSN